MQSDTLNSIQHGYQFLTISNATQFKLTSSNIYDRVQRIGICLTRRQIWTQSGYPLQKNACLPSPLVLTLTNGAVFHGVVAPPFYVAINEGGYVCVGPKGGYRPRGLTPGKIMVKYPWMSKLRMTATHTIRMVSKYKCAVKIGLSRSYIHRGFYFLPQI